MFDGIAVGLFYGFHSGPTDSHLPRKPTAPRGCSRWKNSSRSTSRPAGSSTPFEGEKSDILSAAYESLPGAHAELMAALQSGYRASLGELVSHIEMINSAYQTLHAPGTD